MLYVDTPSMDEIRGLVETRADAAVAIYVPTTPLTQNIGAARIEFANLAKAGLQQLADAGFDKRRAALLADSFAALHDDDEFWRLQANSLAVFATPDRVVSFRLANHLKATVQVSDRFHIKPLMRAVTFPQEALILAVSENKVRVLHIASEGPPEIVKVPELPKSAAHHVGKSSLNDRGAAGRIHGAEGQRVRHLQYLKAIDGALRPILVGRKTPLIIAAVDPLAHLYPTVNSYRHLVAGPLRVSPDDMADAALADAARPLLDKTYANELASLREAFDARASQGRTATDLTDVARAATYGAIDTLFVDIDEAVPGTVDDNGVVTLADHDDAINYGVIDEITGRAFLSGARIVAVRRADVPGGGGVAAMLRYAV